MNWQNGVGFLVACLVCLPALMPEISNAINGRKSAKRFDAFIESLIEKRFSYIFILIFLIGAAIRLWKFGIIPAGFNQDGAMGAVDALALAHHGTDRFGMWLPAQFTAWGFGQMSVLLSYLSVPFIAIWGLNRFTARMVVVVISLLALWVIYLLAKTLAGRKAALAVLAFCAINPWQIMQSRWAIDCNMFPNFLLFSVYFLVIGLKKNKKFIYLSMVFFGLCMYTYGIAWYSVPLILLISCIYLLYKKLTNIKEMVISVFTYLLVAWPIFAVMIINTFKLPTLATPFCTMAYFPDTTRAADLLFFSPNFISQLINNILVTINIVLLQKPDLPWNTIPEFGCFYLFSLPFAISGFITLVAPSKEKTEKDSRSALILVWLIVAVFSGMIVNNVNVNRINIIMYPMIFLCGLGIYAIIRKVKLAAVVIAALFITSFTAFGMSYFGNHAKILGDAFFDGFGEALEYVKDLDYDRIYVTNWTQSENSWWVSEPLTLFHHSIDALYYQGKADAWSKSGRKLLPYKERYKYVQMKEVEKNTSESAVYVANINEEPYFKTSDFKLMHFGGYFAAIPVSGAASSSQAGAVKSVANGNTAVLNPGFEDCKDNDYTGWALSLWNNDAGTTSVSVDEAQKHSGAKSVCIVNNSVNDSRLKQSITVEKNSLYKLSFWVKTDNVGADAKGANLSVEGLTDTSDDIKGTSDWTLVVIYGKTDKNQSSFTLTVGLGGYGSINSGRAWFDDVSVEKVDNVPSGARVMNLYNNNSSPAPVTKPSIPRNSVAAGYNISMVIYAGLYVLVIALAFFAVRRKKLTIPAIHEGSAILLLLGVTLCFRVATSQIIEGWPNDISANKYWATSAAQGLSDFYNRGWCDYPPLFIYVLAFIGKLAGISWLQPYFTLLIKLPSILADIATAYMIYRIAKKHLQAEFAVLACAAYVLNPAVYIDSTIWGQVDSFFTMIVVGALALLMKRKLGLATVLFTASILMKPQGIFFLPVLLFELLKSRKLKNFINVIAAGLLTTVAIVLPFAVKMGPLWIFKLYLGTAGEYPSVAMNALNFFSLIGANFVDGTQVPFLFSYNTWGLIFDAIIVGISVFIYFKGRHIATPLVTAVLLNSGAFIFSAKMHERYMYPVIAISLLALVYLKERRILLIFAGFCSTIFLNIHILFYRVLLYDVQGAHLVGSEIYPIVFAISLANVILFVYLVKAAYDILVRDKAKYLDLSIK